MTFNLQGKTATVFGGTGFVGRYVVERLAQAGALVQVVTRHRQSGYFLRTCGTVGQIVPVSCAYKTEAEIAALVEGSSVVVNCLGILAEGRGSRFAHVQTTLPGWIAQACARSSVARLIHISALGIEISQSEYARSKLAGERALLAAFPAATILRPSVIFGAEDNFFNMFAKLSKLAPALPLIGGGKTKFQPVYVGDVADAVMAATLRSDAAGKIYELGGPEIVTFREIYKRLFAGTGVKRMLLPLPWSVARAVARLPLVPLTADQVTSLKTDTVVGADAATLADLGVTATGMDAILPGYLDQYRSGGRFADKKRA